MQSRLETILMTSVSVYVKQFMLWAFGWFLTPAMAVWKKTCHDIGILFFDKHDELIGFDDNRLSMLGLDVRRMNDEDGYWEYSTRNRRY